MTSACSLAILVRGEGVGGTGGERVYRKEGSPRESRLGSLGAFKGCAHAGHVYCTVLKILRVFSNSLVPGQASIAASSHFLSSPPSSALSRRRTSTQLYRLHASKYRALRRNAVPPRHGIRNPLPRRRGALAWPVGHRASHQDEQDGDHVLFWYVSLHLTSPNPVHLATRSKKDLC